MNDLISRQAVIDALDEIESEVADGYGYQYEKWRKYFCGLPSAQPERKTGQWQEDPSGYGFWICSACGFVSEASGADLLYNFCPNCGAKMEKE